MKYGIRIGFEGVEYKISIIKTRLHGEGQDYTLRNGI